MAPPALGDFSLSLLLREKVPEGRLRVRACISVEPDSNPHPALRATFSRWEKEELSFSAPFPPAGEAKIT
jgi:hypothetical protein